MMQHINEQHIQFFRNQVGGHSVLLKDEGSQNVLKPAKENELKFYQYIQKCENARTLKSFIPKFFGFIKLQPEREINLTEESTTERFFEDLIQKRFSPEEKLYIQLEDLTYSISSPCILDIKMGFYAINEKKQAKYQASTSSQLGFRICGMHINQRQHNIFKNKYWGRSLSITKLNYCLAAFFYDGKNQSINSELITCFINKLKGLQVAIANTTEFRWISSSLLLIYEGLNMDVPRLKLIDFANFQSVENATEPDTQMVLAIDNLINTLISVKSIESFDFELATQ